MGEKETRENFSEQIVKTTTKITRINKFLFALGHNFLSLKTTINFTSQHYQLVTHRVLRSSYLFMLEKALI